MRTLGRATLLVFAGSLIPLHAPAQGRFCIGGDTSKLSGAEKSACLAKLTQVQTLAKRFNAPEDWHFVVVCDETGWSDYADFSKQPQAELANASADTDLEERSTFFRGERLAAGDAARTERVVAHEIASMTLHSVDERLIEQQIAIWLPSPSSTAAPVLTASR